MSKFEVVSKYADAGLHLPVRATANAAGYDFEVAEDTFVPSLSSLFDNTQILKSSTMTLEEMAAYTKKIKAKPTLVPTGIKCQLEPYEYLELSVRSSLPLKHWLILANGVGIIDSDYYNNPDNEGHIYFQLINLSPFGIQLKKGDRIGQGIIRTYGLIDGDKYNQGIARIGGFGSTSKKLYNSFINIHGKTFSLEDNAESSTAKTESINAPYIIGNTEITVPIEPKYITTTNVEEDKYYQITLDDITKTL